MESSDTVTRLQGESALVFQNSSPLASLLLSLKTSLAALLQNYLDLGRRIMKRDTGMGNTPERYAFFRLDTIFGFFIRYDTISIRYFGLRKDLLFEEFSANFRWKKTKSIKNFQYFSILCKGAHPCTSSLGQGGGKRVLEDLF